MLRRLFVRTAHSRATSRTTGLPLPLHERVAILSQRDRRQRQPKPQGGQQPQPTAACSNDPTAASTDAARPPTVQFAPPSLSVQLERLMRAGRVKQALEFLAVAEDCAPHEIVALERRAICLCARAKKVQPALLLLDSLEARGGSDEDVCLRVLQMCEARGYSKEAFAVLAHMDRAGLSVTGEILAAASGACAPSPASLTALMAEMEERGEVPTERTFARSLRGCRSADAPLLSAVTCWEHFRSLGLWPGSAGLMDYLCICAAHRDWQRAEAAMQAALRDEQTVGVRHWHALMSAAVKARSRMRSAPRGVTPPPPGCP